MKHVICSHGFGVKSDSHGMFSDIAAAFADYDFRLFNYNDEWPDGDTVMRPLGEMAAELQRQIDAVGDGEIVLLSHSLGCVVTGLANLSRVSKVVLLTPPVRISKQRIVELLQKREGSQVNLGGVSILPRSDGSTTYVPKEFIDSVENVDSIELYQKIANTKPTVIIRALQDELIGLTNVDGVKNAQLIDVDTNHNFTNDYRQTLIETLQQVL